MTRCDAQRNHQYSLPLKALYACVHICALIYLHVCVMYFVSKNAGIPLISVLNIHYEAGDYPPLPSLYCPLQQTFHGHFVAVP